MRPLFILLLFLRLSANAQDVAHQWFNSPDQWANAPLDTCLTLDRSGLDTCIIVASNRKLDRKDMRYMTEIRDEGKIAYYFVYVNKGLWHVLPAPSLTAAMDYMPNKNRDWAVYTEGMGKTFIGDLDRGIRLSAYYRLNVLLLDYPSISSHKKNLGNYIFAKRNASEAYHEFMPVLDTVKQLKLAGKMGDGCLTLFFHSMGNKVMRQIARHDDKLNQLNETIWVNNLVLNAPCVPERGHWKWLEKIHFARSVYVDYNPDDRTLYWAHVVSFKKQLGEKLRKPLAPGVYYVNFASVAREGHSNFLPLPMHPQAVGEAIGYYRQVLHGNILPLADENQFKPSTYFGIGWDIIGKPANEGTQSASLSTR
jgi:hypothetical protein